ncbi:fatty acyl-AMP ligase [Kitasatospora indigofera]|uniref:Polyketide synthase n=1 Tax=Kitasatospora indigofera TaxID=67307 RepID=A0A919KK09_9ACTN|nr:fatty acyl-AMP ligase [Kitasatospora indigofera]GHH60159.1 polyketide synthase [Kitasatospora indigofera]
MTRFETFTELVLARTGALGAKDAFIFLRDGATGSEADHLTYADLDTEAKRVASWLQSKGTFGKQVLLLFPSSMAFVKAFVGCLYAGAVAVPAPLPGDQGHHFQRVAGILHDAEVRAVLTDAANEPQISAWLAAEGLDHISCLAVDGVDEHGEPAYGDPEAWTRPSFGPDHLAFLQYTSGSTSAPKGVMVSHRNLLANEAAIQRSVGSDSESRFGGWLPFYHDMGLIGHILQPLWLGGSAVLMSPVSFLKRPFRWLQMIDQYKVTVGGGPNFAYDLCLRRVTDEQLATLDLSSWVAACNGAEPIRAETLRAFAERFAPAGFRAESFFPCYGMAETTLLVSGTPLGQAPVERTADAVALERGELLAAGPDAPARTLVSSGIIEDFDVRIVEPQSLAQQPDGHVGEIWIKGDSVAPGYWARPETNKEIFDAGIAGTEGPDAAGWLRTGDLGVLDEGQLYVTGRLKEMVIINGRNLYPHDVERAVQAMDPALGAGAGSVFAVDTDREHLVVVQEVRATAVSTDLPTLLAGIRQLVGKEFNVPAGNVLLVRPGTIRKTTSGKIQRTLMRKLFLDGAITALHSSLDTEVAALLRASAEPVLEPVA